MAERRRPYVNLRSREKGPSGRPISHVTIRKEILTFASIWNRWALPFGLVKGPAPTRGLLYGKGRAKPPFQTREQIERQVKRGGLAPLEVKELWGSLFLTLPEVRELLGDVKANVRRRWVHVAVSLAAYTGARRLEMLRSRVDDVDFEAGTFTIREKKRDRSREFTFRSVPMTDALKETLADWLSSHHPGGPFTLCNDAGERLTLPILSKAFRRGLRTSRWHVAGGYHVLRHSFASNCALKGVDQRLIDSWMGHQTEEMRRRYRHLFPEQQQQAIRAVFG